MKNYGLSYPTISSTLSSYDNNIQWFNIYYSEMGRSELWVLLFLGYFEATIHLSKTLNAGSKMYHCAPPLQLKKKIIIILICRYDFSLSFAKSMLTPSPPHLYDTFGGLLLVSAISSWAGLISIPITLVKYGAKRTVPCPEPQPTSTARLNCFGV